MNLKLISLEQTKVTLEIKIEIGKKNQFDKIFIGQNLWNNKQIVGKINKIKFINLEQIVEQAEQNEIKNYEKKYSDWQNITEKLEKENVVKSQNKIEIENEFRVLQVECVGNFENCKWKSGWKFGTNFVLNPKMWEKLDNLEDLETDLVLNFEKNVENRNNLENKKIEKINTNQTKKYYFIPTVQKFETVKSGQKLGFVEVYGHLYWLICPNFENQYQIQIESGEFELFSKIGVLLGKKSEYQLTLEQSFNFNFDLVSKKSKEIVTCGIPLFDLFCPFIQGNKTILSGFDKIEIQSLFINLDANYPQKPVIITDFDFFVPKLEIFKTENWLELAKYFALCGNNVIVFLENLPVDFANYLDYFGTFETIGGESCSISLFWKTSTKNYENEIQDKKDKLKYFENYWKLDKKIHIPKKNSTKKSTQNLELNRKKNSNYSSNYARQKITLPDLTSSFGVLDFKNLLIDNIHRQNSVFINQKNSKNVLSNLNLGLTDLTNPFYELVMAQKTQNIEQSLILWELFSWTKNKFENEINQEFEQNWQDKVDNWQNSTTNSLENSKNMSFKIQQNWQKLTELIQRTLQNEQNTGQSLVKIKSEISKILE